jgi:hypothetical protein
LSTTSLVTLLSQFNLNDIREIEERVVDVGMDEVYMPLITHPLLSMHYNYQMLLLLSVCLVCLVNFEQQSR